MSKRLDPAPSSSVRRELYALGLHVASAPVPDIVCVPLQVIILAQSRSDVLVGGTDSYCVLGSHVVSNAQVRPPDAVRPDA